MLGSSEKRSTEASLGLFERRERVIAALKLCTSSRNLRKGKAVHDAAIECGDDSDLYVASTLINMYAKCGTMSDASVVFDSLKHPDAVCWNALILGYADHGECETALHLFLRMHREGCAPNTRTFVAVLKACANEAVKDESKPVVVKERGDALQLLAWASGCGSDAFVKNTLLDMYAKCGFMEDAQAVFDGLTHPDLVAWTALLLGYAENGEGETALDLFSRLRYEGFLPDDITFLAALKACGSLAARQDDSLLREAIRKKGKQLHLLVLENGGDSACLVQVSLLDMYAKCGNMKDARTVFDRMIHLDVVAWTALMLGYAENGEAVEALDVFLLMSRERCSPDGRTFISALKACSILAAEEVHASAAKLHLLSLTSGCGSDIYVQAILVDLYAKCGSMKDARQVFRRVKHPDVVCWNSLLLGHAENGEGDVSLSFFFEMRREGCHPDSRSYVAAAKACSDLAARESKLVTATRGEKLHLLVARTGLDSDMFVQGALVDMYGKCGRLEDAHRVFDTVRHPNVVCWTALISGYADNGESKTALKLFSLMESEGCTPDAGLFVALIKASGALSALELGKAFHAQICSRGLEHDLVLRNALVDFYAKCGCLAEAEHEFTSQAARDLISWNSLIAGYSRHGDTNGVFAIFDRMQAAGTVQPDGITFLSVLAACSHAGLVGQGRYLFELMSRKFNIKPGIEHYNCMADLFGRANKLEDCMALLRSMPCAPNEVTWTTVLGACRKWRHLMLGQLALEALERTKL